MSKKTEEPVDHTIRCEETGEEMGQDDKAQLRKILAEKGVDAIVLPPGMEEEMAAKGITKQMILDAMMKGARKGLT